MNNFFGEFEQHPIIKTRMLPLNQNVVSTHRTNQYKSALDRASKDIDALVMIK